MKLFTQPEVVVCRPAQAKDTDAVMELSSHIWEGDDYIPEVWDEWMADPDGLLGVAEMDGRVAGVFKLTKFQEGEWYMEGLRVHPEFREQGVASHIHNYVLETWRQMGSGLIRLTTASYNVKVHHMCEQSGFKRIAEFIHYRAPVISEGKSGFSKLDLDDTKKAMEFVLNSPLHALSSGLINLDWVFADPQLKHIAEAAQSGHAWWWRGGIGFLSIWEEEDGDERYTGIQLAACSIETLGEFLLDFRRLMGEQGYTMVNWAAPNRPEVIPVVEGAGFERRWDISLYIFELRA